MSDDRWRSRAGRAVTAVAAAWLAGVGCGAGDAARTDRAPAATGVEPAADAWPAGAVSAPIDLGAVMRQVHFAYRPKGTGFEGGDAAYEVEVSAGGAVRVVPYGGDAGGAFAGRPATFRTEAVARVGGSPAARAAARIEPDGSLAIALGEAVETLRNGPDGVEQGWRFAARPAGSGELVVRVRVEGLPFAGRTDKGLHFADAATGLGLRYGWGTWVGADGRRAEVRGAWTGGAIEMRVPAAIVDGAAYPAALDPPIGPEFGMDNPVIVPVAAAKSPSVAYGAGAYLVVWDDNRTANTHWVVGARVKPDGTVLDPTGLFLGTCWPTGSSFRPAVASDGSGWLVAWEKFDPAGPAACGNTGKYVIVAARVKADGTVLDATPIVVAGGAPLQRTPDVASSGAEYLVTWIECDSYVSQVRGARVKPDGTVADPTGIDIAKTPEVAASYPPSVAYGGGRYLVLWHRLANPNYDVRGARVKPDGTVEDATPTTMGLIVNTVNAGPAAAFDGTSFLVVWDTGSNGTDIFGRRVNPDFTFPGAPFVISAAPSQQARARVAFGGGVHVVVWEDSRTGKNTEAYAARVKPDGTLLDPQGILLSPGGNQASPFPAVASDGASHLAVWTDLGKYPLTSIAGARVKPDGTVQDPGGIAVSTSANTQGSPAVAFDATSYLVVWADRRAASGQDVYGVRVKPDATILDPAGIAISTAPGDQSAPRVAAGPGAWLVVWEDRRGGGMTDVYAARVKADGTVVDPAGIALAKEASVNERSPSVASDGTIWLAAWERSDDIHGARVKADGTVLDTTPIAISTYSGAQQYPDVGFAAGSFFVAWDDLRVSGNSTDIYGAHVQPDGKVVETDGLLLASAPGYQRYPRLSFDGAAWLVVWQDTRSNSEDVYAVRVKPDGTLFSPSDKEGFKIAATGDQEMLPSAAWDGARHLVVWQRGSGQLSDVHAARVTPAGTVLDPGGTPVAASADGEQSPSVAAQGQGRSLVVYQRYDAAAPFHANRVRGRFVNLGADTGAPCAGPAECASSYCVDGVCCATPCNGLCEACAAAKKESGQGDGACGPAKSGTDPHATCKDDGSPSCQQNGLCDGKGACQKYTTPQDCAPLACKSGDDCASGFCADGICCDKACGGTCEACTKAKKGSGKDGVCEPVAADTDPDAECPEDPGYPQSCKADGQCDGAGKCRANAKQGTGCGNNTCTNGVQQGLACNGKGGCVPAQVACEPYKCQKDGTCGASCAADTDCAGGVPGWFCDQQKCKEKSPDAQACDKGIQCASGYCADGVCCKTACTGQCEACNVAPNVGACVPVTGDPKGGRPKCKGAPGSACAGTCDGSKGSECKYPGGAKACEAACKDAVETVGACDGDGTCQKGTPKPCAGYACDATMNRCRAGCAADGDCATGYACAKNGTCVPKTSATCDGDHKVKSTDGTEFDCAPYKCDPDGKCKTACASATDCVAPSVCDATGKCVSGAPAAGEEAAPGGCGCRLAGGGAPGSPGRWPWAAAFAAAIVAAAKRSRRRAARRT